MKPFWKLFKEAREKKKITYRDLAKDIGVANTALVKYEKGYAYPRENILKKVCEALLIDIKVALSSINYERMTSIATDPVFRKICLDTYAIDDVPRNAFLKKEMQKEFTKHADHPIESLLQTEANKRLHAGNIIKKSDSITSDEFSPVKKAKLFKKVISAWWYVPKSGYVIIGYEKKKGEWLYSRFYAEKINWREEKGREAP